MLSYGFVCLEIFICSPQPNELPWDFLFIRLPAVHYPLQHHLRSLYRNSAVLWSQNVFRCALTFSENMLPVRSLEELMRLSVVWHSLEVSHFILMALSLSLSLSFPRFFVYMKEVAC